MVRERERERKRETKVRWEEGKGELRATERERRVEVKQEGNRMGEIWERDKVRGK